MDEVIATGLRIAYRRAGRGAPLVLLHGGFGFDSRSWQAQLDDLSDSFDVVAWDAPGCGDSEDAPDPFSMADYADCLAGFIAALGLERPHVLGISFGGALALALFGDHPTVPGSLVLVGAYAGWAGSLPPEEVSRRVRVISDQTRRPVDEWLPSYLPGMFSPAVPDTMRAQALELMSGVRPSGNLTMLRAMAEADLRDVLPRVDVPTLILHGDADARSPLEVGRELHERIPGSRLVVLPGVGHASNLEATAAFNGEVRSFLGESS
jgi:pimeloyl-ACP methyl ester carboxylesterase